MNHASMEPDEKALAAPRVTVAAITVMRSKENSSARPPTAWMASDRR